MPHLAGWRSAWADSPSLVCLQLSPPQLPLPLGLFSWADVAPLSSLMVRPCWAWGGGLGALSHQFCQGEEAGGGMPVRVSLLTNPFRHRPESGFESPAGAGSEGQKHTGPWVSGVCVAGCTPGLMACLASAPFPRSLDYHRGVPHWRDEAGG